MIKTVQFTTKHIKRIKYPESTLDKTKLSWPETTEEVSWCWEAGQTTRSDTVRFWQAKVAEISRWAAKHQFVL